MKDFSRIIRNLCLYTVISFFLILSLAGYAAAQPSFSDRDIFTFPDAVDLYFAYYPSSDQAVLLVPAEGVSIIVFVMTPFEQVDQGAIDPSAWQTVDSIEIWPGDTVVLRSSAGGIYKLAFTLTSGEDVPRIQVTYAPVPPALPDPTPPSSVELAFYTALDVDSGEIFTDPTVASVIFCEFGPVEPTPTPGVIPEPGSGILLLLGLLGLLGAWMLARRKRKRTKGMWFLLLISIVLMSVVGARWIVAQQSCTLMIEKQGSGTGQVIERGIDCGTVCSVSYGNGEVLNLKAIPDENSVFVGWMVNGNPYQEIFRMTGDTALTVVFAGQSSSFKIIGPDGGTLSSPMGASVTIPQDALTKEVLVGLTDESEITLPLSLPTGYTFLGAVTLDLGGNSLSTPGDIAVPASAPVPERVIVARVVEVAGATRLTLVDSASANGQGFLETNSPPFPSVLSGGTYVLMEMPSGLGTLGVEITSESGQPVTEAFVEVLTESLGTDSSAPIQQALEGQSVFVGITDSDGFTAIPGVLPSSQVRALAYNIVDGVTSLGISPSMPLPELPQLPPLDLFSELINMSIEKIEENTGVEIPPGPPPPCPCQVLFVSPPQIPEDQDTIFTPNATLDLHVACGGNNVTKSTDLSSLSGSLANLVNALVSGWSTSITHYNESNKYIVTVSQEKEGRVIVIVRSAGTTSIQIWNESYNLSTWGIRRCVAFRYVPVTVSMLTINTIGNGSVSRSPNQPTYYYGDVITLTANPYPGSYFDYWSGDISGSDNPTTITIEDNSSVIAHFQDYKTLFLAISTSQENDYIEIYVDDELLDILYPVLWNPPDDYYNEKEYKIVPGSKVTLVSSLNERFNWYGNICYDCEVEPNCRISDPSIGECPEQKILTFIINGYRWVELERWRDGGED